jgi:hypothetical protein
MRKQRQAAEGSISILYQASQLFKKKLLARLAI